MGAYIVRRLLLIIPTLFLVIVIIFSLARLIPGDIIDLIQAEQEVSATPLSRADIEHALGLDVPIYVQFGRWIGGIFLHGNFGNSLWTKRPVTEEITNRLPVSFELGLIALITAILLALPVGIYSAIRQDTAGDYLSRSFAIACIALPSFWIATIVIVFPSIWWHWSPRMEYVTFFENPIENLKMFIIPGVILGLVPSGATMRMMRTMMLEVLRQDYIRTAWSKGLSERRIIFSHALKNALIPVVTVIGLRLHVVIGGSIIIESIFCLPGVGMLLVEVINKRDYTMLSGINLFIAFFVLLINLVVDLTYAYLDPRIHYK